MWELYNIMASTQYWGVLKETRDADKNIITSDSIICNILPPQLKKVSAWYKVMCGCDCLIYAKTMHLYFLTWTDHHLKQLKDWSNNSQNRRSGEIYIYIYDAYKNSVRYHGWHIHRTASDMAKTTIFPVLLHTMRYCTEFFCYVVVIKNPVWSY